MGKIIEFGDIKKQSLAPVKLPEPTSKASPQPDELDYLGALQPLADEARRIAAIYDMGAKDVLTDALCLLIEEAILEECQKQLE